MYYKLEVSVDKTFIGLENTYTYLSNEYVYKGVQVIVPFGVNNKLIKALVLNSSKINEQEFFDLCNKKTKYINQIIDEKPLSEEMFALLHFIKNRTLSNYYEVFKLISPSFIYGHIKSFFEILDYQDIKLNEDEQNFLSLIKKHKGLISEKQIIQNSSIIQKLIDNNIIKEKKAYKKSFNDLKYYTYSNNENIEELIKKTKLTKRQKQLIELLDEKKDLDVKQIYYYSQITKSVIDNLVKKNLVIKKEVFFNKNEKSLPKNKTRFVNLNEEQQNVFNFLVNEFLKNTFSQNLLYGITGSGKTVVYIKFIEEVLKKNKNVILLVPEISLTPQVVDTFKSYFGNIVTEIHSNLSKTEKLRRYELIKKGDVKIIIGTRSALFAPVSNIGAIIIDEEQDSSYYSDKTPRYSAKDVAWFRCKFNNCVLLLGSATPNISTFYQCTQNKINLLILNKRYSKNKLPNTIIVDMKDEIKKGNTYSLSSILVEQIKKEIDKNNQVIILVNKRGYHKVLICSKCLEVCKCKKCNIAFTYHKANDKLMCHHCGDIYNSDKKCDFCDNDKFLNFGFGTQKIEDEIYKLIPEAKILRMDFDTTTGKYSYQNYFEKFRNKEYNILIGTQMIAKGLDFEDVTLVGVLNVESILYQSGYKGHEKLFTLISQVIGRAGRSKKSGKAIIQTTEAENEIIKLASLQDYDSFYKDEIMIRKAMLYPPFCHICLITFKGLKEDLVFSEITRFVDILKQNYNNEKSLPIKLLGPCPYNIFKVNNVYRYKIALKCINNHEFREFLCKNLKIFLKGIKNGVTVTVDFNNDVEV